MNKQILTLIVLFVIIVSLVISACTPSTIQSTTVPASTAMISSAAAPAIMPSLAISEGAAAGQIQSSAKGALSVSFDPNPVAEGVDWNKGFWIYRVTIKETQGVGITIKNLIVKYYSNNGSVIRTSDYHTKDWFDDWLPGGNLPANGNVITQAGIPVQSAIDYGIFTYNCVDVNGNNIQATGRVDFKR